MVAKLTGADSRTRDTTAPSGRELYNLQFSLQTASPETSGYTLISVTSQEMGRVPLGIMI
jgi:hypothetical protein